MQKLEHYCPDEEPNVVLKFCNEFEVPKQFTISTHAMTDQEIFLKKNNTRAN